jgi:hypothetical protein
MEEEECNCEDYYPETVEDGSYRCPSCGCLMEIIENREE